MCCYFIFYIYTYIYYPSLKEDSDEERERRPSEDCDVSEAELATEDGEKSYPTCLIESFLNSRSINKHILILVHWVTD